MCLLASILFIMLRFRLNATHRRSPFILFGIKDRLEGALRLVLFKFYFFSRPILSNFRLIKIFLNVYLLISVVFMTRAKLPLHILPVLGIISFLDGV